MMRLRIAAAIAVALMAGCDSMVKNPPSKDSAKQTDVDAKNSQAEEQQSASPPAKDSSIIIKRTKKMLPEESLPTSNEVERIEDLTGWLEWQLRDANDVLQLNNDFSKIAVVKEFNRRAAKLRGMRVRLPVPVVTVHKRDETLIEELAEFIGIEMPPITENDFIAEFGSIPISWRPVDSKSPSRADQRKCSASLTVTPFKQEVPPYRLRYSNHMLERAMGMVFINQLFNVQDSLRYTDGNFPVLEGRIHFLEMDVEPNHALGQCAFRLSLVLSSVNIVGESPQQEFVLKPSELRRRVLGGEDQGALAESESRLITFRAKDLLHPRGPRLQYFSYGDSKTYDMEPPFRELHWHLSTEPLVGQDAFADSPPNDSDRLALGSLVSRQQLQAIKPNALVTIAGTQKLVRSYKDDPAWHVWLTGAKIVALFDAHGTPVRLPSVPVVNNKDANRTGDLTALINDPLPHNPTIAEPPQRKNHRIYDLSGVLQVLSAEMMSATARHDAVAYRSRTKPF